MCVNRVHNNCAFVKLAYEKNIKHHIPIRRRFYRVLRPLHVMFYRPFNRSMGLWIINEFLKSFSTGGWTYTSKALNIAKNQLFHSSYGARSGVSKVCQDSLVCRECVNVRSKSYFSRIAYKSSQAIIFCFLHLRSFRLTHILAMLQKKQSDTIAIFAQYTDT